MKTKLSNPARRLRNTQIGLTTGVLISALWTVTLLVHIAPDLQLDDNDQLTEKDLIKDLFLPVALPVVLLIVFFALCAVWKQWRWVLIIMCLLTVMDGVVQFALAVSSMSNLLHAAMEVTLDTLMCFGYWQLADMIRLKHRRPELFGGYKPAKDAAYRLDHLEEAFLDL